MSTETQFAGLEDLEESIEGTSTCRLNMPDGTVKRFKLGHLTYCEYNEIALSVSEPEIPTRVVNGKRVDWPESPAYANARSLAQDERRRRLLVASLEKAGLVIPGGDAKGKADNLSRYSTIIIAGLLLGFARAHTGIGGQIEKLADTFQPLSNSDESHSQGESTE